jgi:hypothetical protein
VAVPKMSEQTLIALSDIEALSRGHSKSHSEQDQFSISRFFRLNSSNAHHELTEVASLQ